MTGQHRAAGAGSGQHYPLALFAPIPGGGYRAACSCGWRRDAVNTKRENAIRAARRHCQEAR